MVDQRERDAAALSACQAEIDNFVRIFRLLQPPRPGLQLDGIDVYGRSLFFGGATGGDHIIYVDFASRYDLDRRGEIATARGDHETARKLAENRDKMGILLADVAGHSMTDALVAAMLHQAFLTGVEYELDRWGNVTTRLFELLNNRFYQSVSFEKYITMIYGEISKSGVFRFIIAGHPHPLVFSAEFDSFVTISPDRLTTFFPMGMFPSEDDVDLSKIPGALRTKKNYAVNEVGLLGGGDILLLFTDGLSEHARGEERFVPGRLECRLRAAKHLSAREIHEAILDDAVAFATPEDDLSLVVIRRS